MWEIKAAFRHIDMAADRGALTSTEPVAEHFIQDPNAVFSPHALLRWKKGLKTGILPAFEVGRRRDQIHRSTTTSSNKSPRRAVNSHRRDGHRHHTISHPRKAMAQSRLLLDDPNSCACGG